jgi:WD40 repeat protein
MSPMCLDYWYDPTGTENLETTLLFGTDNGQINIFTFYNDKMFENNGSKKIHCISVDLDSTTKKSPYGVVYKKKVHNDWVHKIRYYHELHSVVSCSSDPDVSLVIGTGTIGQSKWRFSSVPVHKGVNTFAYCIFPVVLVTGGTDRQLRLWNPRRLTNPMASLKGHNSPICEIVINQSAGQIISLSLDRVIKVWDIRKQNCLQTLPDPITRKPENVISTLYFNNFTNNKLLAASNVITVYNIKVDKNLSVGPTSHDNNVRSVLYNPIFKEVVSACDNGVIKVWVGFIPYSLLATKIIE